MKKFIPICISCSFLLVFPFLIAEEPDFYGKINVSYENAKKSSVQDTGFENNASIIGVINKIEIWNPSILDKVDKESSKIKNDEYDELANKIII